MNCQPSRTETEAALCASIRSANAAERANKLSKQNLLLGLFQAWGLFFSLLSTGAAAIFTGIAAKAATKATDLAERSAEESKNNIEISRITALAAQKSAEATVLAAKAAVAGQLPIITIGFPEILSSNEILQPGQPYGGVVETGLPSAISIVTDLRMANQGRSVAFPQFMDIGWSVSESLPIDPIYVERKMAPIHDIIEIDYPQNHYYGFDLDYMIQMSDEQISQISKGIWSFWFYIAFTYRDVLGLDRQVRYCWKWSQSDGVGDYYFSPDTGGGTAYNQAPALN